MQTEEVESNPGSSTLQNLLAENLSNYNERTAHISVITNEGIAKINERLIAMETSFFPMACFYTKLDDCE